MSGAGAGEQGDSGFLLVRGGKPLLRSEALQHFFDCPLQLGAYPEFTNATDSVDDAVLYNFEVQLSGLRAPGRHAPLALFCLMSCPLETYPSTVLVLSTCLICTNMMNLLCRCC